jgi:hypothetical protein
MFHRGIYSTRPPRERRHLFQPMNIEHDSPVFRMSGFRTTGRCARPAPVADRPRAGGAA